MGVTILIGYFMLSFSEDSGVQSWVFEMTRECDYEFLSRNIYGGLGMDSNLMEKKQVIELIEIQMSKDSNILLGNLELIYVLW